MSFVTIIWSMAASACLTLALLHVLAWWQKRTTWANPFFALAAAAAFRQSLHPAGGMYPAARCQALFDRPRADRVEVVDVEQTEAYCPDWS